MQKASLFGCPFLSEIHLSRSISDPKKLQNKHNKDILLYSMNVYFRSEIDLITEMAPFFSKNF